MSRNDPHYFKLDMDILHGEKIGQLTKTELHTYIFGYWRLSVLCRSECIKCAIVTSIRVSKSCGTSARLVPIHTQKLHNLGLITVHTNGDVTVHGTMARHAKLNWDEYTPECAVQNLYRIYTEPIRVCVRGIARQHDSTTAKKLSIPNLIPESDPIVDNSENDSGLGLEGGQKIGSESDTELHITSYRDGTEEVEYLPKPKPAQIEGATLESKSQLNPTRPSQITDPFKVRDESWQICNGLGIEDTDSNMNTLQDMFSRYSGVGVKQAYLGVKDRMESDKSGTSDRPLENPIAYMWTLLRKDTSHD